MGISWKDIFLPLSGALLVFGCASNQKDISNIFEDLASLNSDNYTGGLPQENRRLAKDIREAFLKNYPEISCESPDASEGELIGYSNEEERFNDLSIENVPTPIRPLIEAFYDEKQEIRDTATFAMGLFGPSGKVFAPFLGKRFAEKYNDNAIKGDWYSDAYGKIICENIASARFPQVIPDHLLPETDVWSDYLEQSAILMANLYLDPNIEYPPGMMGDAYGNYAIASRAGPAAPLLAKILEDEHLSLQKKREAARAISFLDPKEMEVARRGLISLVSVEDEELKYHLAEALVKLKDPHSVKLLIDRMNGRYLHWAWEDPICEIGEAAFAAEARLLELLVEENVWPSDQRAAVHALGCIKSSNSIPALLLLLEFPDWETKETIAIALGEIGDKSQPVIDVLLGMAQSHWSKRVRDAAIAALINLEQKNLLDKLQIEIPVDDSDVTEGDIITIRMSPGPIDHGLPWCNENGRYSIDGVNWFYISWIDPGLPSPPPQLSGLEFWDYGTRQFFTVDDGWLFGADLGHYDGHFKHISSDGEISELDEENHTDILAFAKLKNMIYAFGYQVLKGGEGGSLFEVFRGQDGEWTSHRVAALPSRPFYYSVSPDGELLLSDGPNEYAVINNQIVPLKCEIQFEEDYFK